MHQMPFRAASVPYFDNSAEVSLRTSDPNVCDPYNDWPSTARGLVTIVGSGLTARRAMLLPRLALDVSSPVVALGEAVLIAATEKFSLCVCAHVGFSSKLFGIGVLSQSS